MQLLILMQIDISWKLRFDEKSLDEIDELDLSAHKNLLS